MYKCEIIADSVSPQKNRLTTFKVTYPRIIHAEMCRHRMMSRNTASSRAIPFEKMVKDVQEDPFIPIAWQKDHKGMQGTEYIIPIDNIYGVKDTWLATRDKAVELATSLNKQEVTKQLCNRLLEPFVWTTELITTSEEGLMNFFELRCPKYTVSWYPLNRPEASEPTQASFRSSKDAIKYTEGECSDWTEQDWREYNESQAEIHIQKIAEMMWDCYNESTPKQLKAGDWHIPFGDISMSILDQQELSLKFQNIKSIEDLKCRIATARCARISYTTLGDNPKIDYEADIKLHDKLLNDKHSSPFEHCARAMSDDEYETFVKGQIIRIGCETERYEEGDYSEDVVIKKDIQGWCNNYRGFIQYRYLIENNYK